MENKKLKSPVGCLMFGKVPQGIPPLDRTSKTTPTSYLYNNIKNLSSQDNAICVVSVTQIPFVLVREGTEGTSAR